MTSGRAFRVLQVIETGGPGGAETIVAALSEDLVASGHRVQAIIADGTWLPGELRRRGITHQFFPRSKGAIDLGLLRTLQKAVKAFAPDIVHAHLFQGAVYAAVASRLARVPCVVTLHGHADLTGTGLKHRMKRAVFIRSASAIAAVSAELAAAGEEVLGMAAGAIHVVVNGVTDRAGTPMPVPLSQPDHLRVVAVGNIRPSKDYPTLLKAIALLRRTGLHVELDILGEPDRAGLQATLVALTDQLGVADAVKFRGFISDPTQYLQSANCFALSSSMEGFSLAVVEAMLAGVPVVATRSGGPETIIAHEHSGLLVEVGNPESLAQAIRRVLEDRALAARLSANARIHASSSYSVRAMTDRYLALYQHVVRGA